MSQSERVSVNGMVSVDIPQMSANGAYTTTRQELCKDEFACAAMQALLSQPLVTLQAEYATYQLQCPTDKMALEMQDWLADRAYQIADAMLRRRWK